VGVAAPLHMGVVAPPTATVQPTVVTSVAASSNNNGRTTSTSANNIRDSGEFSPSQKEQPGKVLSLLEACFDLILSPSPSVKIQIMSGKNKENMGFKFKLLFFCSPSNSS
jgi:hypothetical protein